MHRHLPLGNPAVSAKTCLKGRMSVVWEDSYCIAMGLMQLLTYRTHPAMTKMGWRILAAWEPLDKRALSLCTRQWPQGLLKTYDSLSSVYMKIWEFILNINVERKLYHSRIWKPGGYQIAGCRHGLFWNSQDGKKKHPEVVFCSETSLSWPVTSPTRLCHYHIRSYKQKADFQPESQIDITRQRAKLIKLTQLEKTLSYKSKQNTCRANRLICFLVPK